MKKHAAPLVLVLAAVLVAVGFFLRHHDPATAYTTNPAAWRAYEEGERLLRAYRQTEADSMLTHAVDLDPDLAPAHVALGELYTQLGRDEALRHHLHLADSLAAGIEQTRARLLLQVRLAALPRSRYHAVRDSLLDMAQRVAPLDIAVLSTIALNATYAGDLAGAETAWQKLLDVDPNHANAYNYLGYLYLQKGRYEDAEAAMRRYAFVAPDLANPHDSLGEVLMTVGRYEEAERELHLAMQKQPDFPYSPLNLAYIHLMRGEVPKAIDLIDRVLKVLAGTALARQFERTTIHHLFTLRLADLLEIFTDRFLAQEPDPRQRALVRAQQLLGRGEALAAIAHVDSLQADHRLNSWYPDIPQADQQVEHVLLRHRALACEQLGLHETAATLLHQALVLGREMPPHHRAPDHIHLAYNLIPLNRLDEARQHIREVLTVNPRRADALFVAASIEAVAGNVAESLHLLDTIEQILRLAVDDFPVLQDARRLRARLPEPDHI